jgi:hypothetical protein
MDGRMKSWMESVRGMEYCDVMEDVVQIWRETERNGMQQRTNTNNQFTLGYKQALKQLRNGKCKLA